MNFMEYEKRISRLQVAVRLGQWYNRWRVKNVKAPPTYFPTGPFKLIKAYAGFDPTYRHKKIAGFIKSELGEHSMWQHRNRDANWTRPHQWNWHDAYNELEAYKTPEKKAAVLAFRNDGLAFYNNRLDELQRAVERRRYDATVYPYRVTCMANWHYKFMIMISPRKSKIQKITIGDLKQYCRENRMVGFSKHTKKADLQQFIIKYEFD